MTENGNAPPPYKDYFHLFARISKQIHANTRTREILACIVENITQVLSAKGCIFWILNQPAGTIETKICHGFDYQSLSRVDYPILISLFNPSLTGPIAITDARNDERIPDLERLGKRLISSITGLYFNITGPYVGLLAVYFTGPRQLSGPEVELLTALGEQGAIALEKAFGYDREMQDLYSQIIQGFALAIEARDPATHGHSLTVARLARATARQMGQPRDQAQKIFDAAILHDIGKIGTRDTILERLGRLSPREMDAVRAHPVLGADILAPLAFFADIQPLVRAHHELYNGQGYPDGKKGDQIPLGARIITVCDAFETMIAGRPHLPKKDLASALTDLKQGAGIRFDPAVVQAFFAAIQHHPDLLGPAAPADASLDILTENVLDLAEQNRIEKKLANPFTSFF